MRAWKVMVKAYSGVLLGGQSKVYSAPFARKQDAQAWLDTVIDQNDEAEREVDYEASGVFKGEYPRRAVVQPVGDKPRPPAVTVGRNS